MRLSLFFPTRILGALLLVLALVAGGSIGTASTAGATEKKEQVYESPTDLGNGSKPPKPPATSWLVGDLDTGEIHSSHAIDKRHAPASTIKLLTALALIEVLDDPKEKVEATFEDMAIDGTKVGVVQKNDYTVDDLFHAMLMSSANDAANALGRAAGGQKKAVSLMNDKAAELGMVDTLATDTSGLDDVKQHTTAADLMKLARAVSENDYLMKVIGTTDYKFPGGRNPETKKKFKGYPIQNHTKIVGQVDGGLGLKNGFTRKAKGSYVAVAERDGRRLVSTLLGADNSSRRIAVDLLEWDFAQQGPEITETVDVRPTPSRTAVPSPPPQDSGTNATEADAMDASSGPGAGMHPWMALGLLAAGIILGAGSVVGWLRLRGRASAKRTE